MPHRRTPLAVALAATAALAAGCGEIEVAPGSLPTPFEVKPIPSASAGQPKYVCTAVYKILTDGAVRLAEHATGTGADAEQGMRQTFADMAGKISAAGAQSTSPEQRQAADKIADKLTAGAQQSDPKAFMNGEFPTVGQEMDATCP